MAGCKSDFLCILVDKLQTLLNLFYIISGAVQVCEAYNNKYYGTINVTYLKSRFLSFEQFSYFRDLYV